MNIPNTLTLARIIAVPLLVWLIIDQEMFAAFMVFVLAGLSGLAVGEVEQRKSARNTASLEVARRKKAGEATLTRLLATNPAKILEGQHPG